MFYSFCDSEFLSHLERACSTALMIRALVLNCIVLHMALLCVNIKSKGGFRKLLEEILYLYKITDEWQDKSSAVTPAWKARSLIQSAQFLTGLQQQDTVLHTVDGDPLRGTLVSPMGPQELFCVGKCLFLWNTNRVEIAVCLPDGKMGVGQVPFVSFPHIPPTLRLHSTVWLSWSNIWFVSHT